jgi:RND superfamily putative drug exporter
VLPLKAVVLNLASVFATWGVMTLVWQEGFGSQLLFGADATGSVVFWAPMIVFAFIYGLSMDYEVFIIARMREEYDATGDTDEAVVRGIARTGRLQAERSPPASYGRASTNSRGERTGMRPASSSRCLSPETSAARCVAARTMR